MPALAPDTVGGFIAFIILSLATNAGFLFIPEVSIACVPFFTPLSRIYDLNQAKTKELYRSTQKWSARRKKIIEMVKMVPRHFSPILSCGAASRESLSLEMRRAITFVLFILPQRLGDESTEKSFRMKKLKLEIGDIPGQFVLQSEQHSLSFTALNL